MAMGGKNERGERVGVEEASNGFIVPEYSPALQASQAIGDPADQVAYVAQTLRVGGTDTGGGYDSQQLVTAFSHTQGIDAQSSETAWPTLRSEGGGHAVSYALTGSQQRLGDTTQETFIPEAASVRRLTPTECERLQGFPDGWTDLGGTPDSRRYAALGDAVTVNVAHWIGQRMADA